MPTSGRSGRRARRGRCRAPRPRRRSGSRPSPRARAALRAARGSRNRAITSLPTSWSSAAVAVSGGGRCARPRRQELGGERRRDRMAPELAFAQPVLRAARRRGGGGRCRPRVSASTGLAPRRITASRTVVISLRLALHDEFAERSSDAVRASSNCTISTTWPSSGVPAHTSAASRVAARGQRLQLGRGPGQLVEVDHALLIGTRGRDLKTRRASHSRQPTLSAAATRRGRPGPRWYVTMIHTPDAGERARRSGPRRSSSRRRRTARRPPPRPELPTASAVATIDADHHHVRRDRARRAHGSRRRTAGQDPPPERRRWPATTTTAATSERHRRGPVGPESDDVADVRDEERRRARRRTARAAASAARRRRARTRARRRTSPGGRPRPPRDRAATAATTSATIVAGLHTYSSRRRASDRSVPARDIQSPTAKTAADARAAIAPGFMIRHRARLGAWHSTT